MPKPLPDIVLCLHCMETRSHKRLKAHVPAALCVCVCVCVCVFLCVPVFLCVIRTEGQKIKKVIGKVELTTFTAFLITVKSTSV